MFDRHLRKAVERERGVNQTFICKTMFSKLVLLNSIVNKTTETRLLSLEQILANNRGLGLILKLR